MPTETKNSTVKMFWIGSDSAAERWLRSDSPSTTPAKNAPERQRQAERAAEP